MIHSNRILWVDDDAGGALAVLGRLIRRRAGLEIDIALDYETAIHFLQKNKYCVVLSDVILPRGRDGGVVVVDLGMQLAEKAAEAGVRSVVFLTIVRRDEVLDRYQTLQSNFPLVQWSYFDKLELMETDSLDKLIRQLHPGESTPILPQKAKK
jgi:hypothetical protein